MLIFSLVASWLLFLDKNLESFFALLILLTWLLCGKLHRDPASPEHGAQPRMAADTHRAIYSLLLLQYLPQDSRPSDVLRAFRSGHAPECSRFCRGAQAGSRATGTRTWLMPQENKPKDIKPWHSSDDLGETISAWHLGRPHPPSFAPAWSSSSSVVAAQDPASCLLTVSASPLH